jgi:hypothetical protein
MSIIKSTLRRIAIRNLDRAITRTYSNAIDSVKLDTIKNYVPKIPKFSNILKSIFLSIVMIICGFCWGGLIFLLLKIFLSSSTALLVTTILMTILFLLMFMGEISIDEVPSVTTQPIYVKDNRYKSGQRFGKNVDVPNTESMIKFTKGQIVINIISSIILYIPSIIFFWIFFTLI